MERVELRQSPRIEARFRCWCESPDVTFYARVTNVSEGGIFLRTGTPLNRGQKALLRFSVARLDIQTSVRVMWARGTSADGPAGMGLRFEDLDDQRRVIIREIIARESRAMRAETR